MPSSNNTEYVEKLSAGKLTVSFVVCTPLISCADSSFSMCTTLYLWLSSFIESSPEIVTLTFVSKSVGSYSFSL